MAQEKSFENRIKRFLDDNNAWFIKYWSGGGCTIKGIPDLLISHNGIFIAAEVKASDGNPTEIQLEKIKEMLEAGTLAFVLLPDTKDAERCKKHICKKYPKYENTPVIDFNRFKKLIELINEEIPINKKIIL